MTRQNEYISQTFTNEDQNKNFSLLEMWCEDVNLLFWASLYMIVMKMTIFKSSTNAPVKDWSVVPDNYTKWLVNIRMCLSNVKTIY